MNQRNIRFIREDYIVWPNVNYGKEMQPLLHAYLTKLESAITPLPRGTQRYTHQKELLC